MNKIWTFLKTRNWRQIASTASTALGVVAAFPYTLGDAATLFPAEWKAKISVASLAAGLILRVFGSVKTQK